MSAKAMLDDAAAEATAGLRIDLAVAQRRADERRTQVRRRASATMASAVAVAAVLALIAVLLPGGVLRAFSPAPAATPIDQSTGLPNHWYYAPPWTPPVTRHPMPAASMVLSDLLKTGNGMTIDGPVLVSADGRQYASLPWSRHDEQVALSADGQDVAWVSQRNLSGDGPARAVVHRIHVSDGRQRDVEIPRGMQVVQVLWAGDRLYVAGWVWPAGKVSRTWYLDAGSDLLRVLCDCAPLPLGADGTGQLIQPTTATGAQAPGIRQLRFPIGFVRTGDSGDEATTGNRSMNADRIASPLAVLDPTGTRSASILGAPEREPTTMGSHLFVQVTASGVAPLKIPITGTDPISAARVLGWAEGGIVVRVETRDRTFGNLSISLRIFAPNGAMNRIVSRKAGTHAYPVAVATQVVAGGKTVAGVVPTFSSTDRNHVRFVWGLAQNQYHIGFLLTALLAIIGLSLLLIGVRRRRQRVAGRPGESAAEEST